MSSAKVRHSRRKWFSTGQETLLTAPNTLSIPEAIEAITDFLKISADAFKSESPGEIRIEGELITLEEMRCLIAYSINNYRSWKKLRSLFRDIETHLNMKPNSCEEEIDRVHQELAAFKISKKHSSAESIFDILRQVIFEAAEKKEAAAKLRSYQEKNNSRQDQVHAQRDTTDYNQVLLREMLKNARPERRETLETLIKAGFTTIGQIVADERLQPYGLHPKRTYLLLRTNVGNVTHRTALSLLPGVTLPKSTGQQMAERIAAADAARANLLRAKQDAPAEPQPQ